MNRRAEEHMEAQMRAQRVATRINLSKQKIEIAYKLLAQCEQCEDSGVLLGLVLNLSEDGACIEGELPGLDCVASLGEGELLVGCNIRTIPYGMVKTLAQVRWVNALQPKKFRFGVQFIKTDEANKALLKKYLISNQISKITGKYSRPQLGK